MSDEDCKCEKDEGDTLQQNGKIFILHTYGDEAMKNLQFGGSRNLAKMNGGISDEESEYEKKIKRGRGHHSINWEKWKTMSIYTSSFYYISQQDIIQK